MRIDAVLRNLGIIGEATKKIPASFGVQLELVWDVLQTKLPRLKDQVSSILQEKK
jgi:uncharacterized protein with HEPN domain